MRVIAGWAKGTRLAAFKGADIRPTLDRVKESFFNKVGPQLEGETFLDLFAGSGSMGIEALSRGAEKVVFVENNHRAQNLIYSNLERCHFGRDGVESHEKNWVLLKYDAIHALHLLEERGYRFDIVYVDPPFADEIYTDCLLALSHSHLLTESSLVVVEHYHKQVLEKKYDKLVFQMERRMGDSCLSYYELASEKAVESVNG
ncbi:MAG: methyltransferase [Nitrospinaceae bacterium]|nr:MAG: methyltransferase [Nitrospinaceae bacterium]